MFPDQNDFMEKKIIFILFLIACYFSFFLRLTSYPLLMWDESRFAVNAFEMLKSNNLIVVSYDGIPDLWNTKPPLSIWVMSIFMKCFGYSELIIRLPSAISAVITAILVFFFTLKYTKFLAAAFFSGMVLVSSIGFIGTHVARTGDADAMTVMFITLFGIYFFKFIEHGEEKETGKRDLYLSGLFFALALLTKSSYALFILPGMIIYIVVAGRMEIFKNKHVYAAFILSLLPLLTYYLLREKMDPGYLNAVWNNEFGGRFNQSLERHTQPYQYYFQNLIRYRFFYWFYLALASTCFLFMGKNSVEKRVMIFCFIAGFSSLLVISFSQTKLEWYDAVVYPFFSIICGITLSKIALRIIAALSIKRTYSRRILYCVFFLLVFFYPYRKVLSYINIKPGETAAIELKYGPFMKELLKDDFKETLLVYGTGYNSHLLYYKYAYSEKGFDVRIINSIVHLRPGDLVAMCDSSAKMELTRKYGARVLGEDEYCSCYRITF
jgi:4-amino-4-deoxy-L-arabinose transferase-like glycosyltransferase